MPDPIVIWPDDGLSSPSREITEFGAELHALLERMWASMYEARGIGLAAPQIGVPLKVAVIDTVEQGGERFVMVNPVIEETFEPIDFTEGCLSVPGETGRTRRFNRVVVHYREADGSEVRREVKGLTAVAVQHETDHLNGMVYVVHLSAMKRDIIRHRMKKLKRRN